MNRRRDTRTGMRQPRRQRPWMRRPASPVSAAHTAPIHVTLGQLVEAVASATADLTDLATNVDRVLHRGGARCRARRGAVRIAWP